MTSSVDATLCVLKRPAIPEGARPTRSSGVRPGPGGGLKSSPSCDASALRLAGALPPQQNGE